MLRNLEITLTRMLVRRIGHDVFIDDATGGLPYKRPLTASAYHSPHEALRCKDYCIVLASLSGTSVTTHSPRTDGIGRLWAHCEFVSLFERRTWISISRQRKPPP